MLVGAAVYTGGELIGGPVFSATAAEAAPDHLRGRYLGLFQLSWGIGGAVTPIAFTWLLAHGQTTLWWVLAWWRWPRRRTSRRCRASLPGRRPAGHPARGAGPGAG